MTRQVVGQAQWVRGRDHVFPFRTRYHWLWHGQRIFSGGGPGAVVVAPGQCMDLRTGEVYLDARFAVVAHPSVVAGLVNRAK